MDSVPALIGEQGSRGLKHKHHCCMAVDERAGNDFLSSPDSRVEAAVHNPGRSLLAAVHDTKRGYVLLQARTPPDGPCRPPHQAIATMRFAKGANDRTCIHIEVAPQTPRQSPQRLAEKRHLLPGVLSVYV